ncbi:Cytochrome P450, E-class, group I [Parasponia andersonii]|uniref:Cytochrome P450, E-class, group I n=1 Tax=Parasponia andersonii TaxID=3476 RepID=A0A2P5DG79_PARAD|nr:Cytochrome P450, E-class, group I [Parasponia andersonii]
MSLSSLLIQKMQELFLAILLHPFIFCLCLISVLLFFLCTKSPNGQDINVPPSPPRLPLIGNLHQLGAHLHKSLGALSDKYGPLMLLYLGQVPTLVVSSADMVREIVKSHDVVFSSRPKTVAADILLYGCKDLAFSPYGEYWKQVRKICVFELLSPKRVQQFQFVREDETILLVDKIRQACQTSNMVCRSSINLSEMLVITSNNVISRCVLGQSLEGKEGRSRALGGLLRSVMVYLMAFSVGDFFPPLRWIDSLRGFNDQLKATFRALDQFFDLVIEEHKSKILESDDGQILLPSAKDFLDILLQLQKDAALLGFELTQNNVKGILLDMFLGGTSTTSAASEWIMSELIRNPRVMKKAQEEVRSVIEKKPKIDANDINQMDYLKCVIKETLRLHPPSPLLGPRETIDQSVEMGGYHIPGKTRVLFNAWAIQRDPSLWDKPEEFLPERFENKSIEYEGQDFEFIPFGVGRRGCPGLKFADTSIEYIIANLLYWFDWRLPGDSGHSMEDLDMSEIYGLSVHKKVPLHLIPIPYSP